MDNHKVESIQYLRRINLVSSEGGKLLSKPVRHLYAREVPTAIQELLSCSGVVCNGIFVPDLSDLLALLIFQPNLISRMSSVPLTAAAWTEVRDHRLLLGPESSEFQLLIGDLPMGNTLNMPRD